MEICAYQTIDKGKGSCYEKCGEWWYHSFDYLKSKYYEESLLRNKLF